MPNIASVLKQEIARLSRREVREQVESTKKASGQYRRDIAALKREVAALKRQMDLLQRDARRKPAAVDSAIKVRFVPKGVRSHRKRLGLSAEEYGRLVGVSAQSIYNWERGQTVPQAEQVRVIAALRAMGKREAQGRLKQMDGKQRRKR
ncbi:MAG: helix-turn-helix domain-containing protein [Sphingomonadaceae bacterium]